MERISLMFSGGIDSTVAAILLSQEYKEVHLLTYWNGYGHFQLSRARKRFVELKEKFGPRFFFSFLDISGIFTRLAINSLSQDYLKYQSGFIWCMGCKIAMHTRSVIYNLENEIEYMADGSSFDTSEMVEQTPLSLSLIYLLYEQFGIKFLTPVYKLTRADKQTMLKKLGFNMGLRIGERHLGIQPLCIPGIVYYLPYLLFNKPPRHEYKKIADFFRAKKQIAEEIIKERMNK